jgi:hypothetical protein
VIIGGLVLALSLGGGATSKVVHVIVTRSQPTSGETRDQKPPTRHHHHRAALPPASAGSNGSFTAPTGGSSALKPGASASFAQLRTSLPGPIDVAVAPLGTGSTVTLGGDSPAHAWSTSKVPVLVALMRARDPGGLTASEQSWAQAAITQSDNQSILDLFGDLEQLKGGLAGASDYVTGVLRTAGDQNTVVATAPPPPGGVTTFGQTEWAPSDAVTFFRALANGCLLPSNETAYVLHLMENIVPGESWGLGSAGFPGSVAFKGGWGPEPSGAYLVRQSGIIDPGSGGGVAVSIVAYPPGGGDTFSVGTQMLTRTAEWLRNELDLKSRSSVGCAAG